MSSDSVLFDDFGAVDFLFNVQLLPSYNVLKVLLLEVLNGQPILN